MGRWDPTAKPDPRTASPPTLRLFLALSLALHFFVFLIIEKAFAPADRQPVTAYSLEFEPTQESGKKQSGETDQTKTDDAGSNDVNLPEDTISLDTKDNRYTAYASKIKAMIWNSWRYPAAAAEKGLEGQVEVLFAIGKDGRLAGVKPIRTSGHGILDNEAQESVRRASPFPPLPSSMRLSRLNVHARFIYSLRDPQDEKSP